MVHDSAGNYRRIDRWLDRLGAALRDRDSRKQAFGRLLIWVRRISTFLTLAYLAWLLVALPLLLRFVGEKNVTFAFFLYVPLQVWLLPLVPLAGATLLLQQWRLLPLIAIAVPIFARWPMSYRVGNPTLPAPTERAAKALTVLSYNRGQHAWQSLQPFKNAVAADLLVFQEAAGRAARFGSAPTYAEFSDAAGEGEFVLLSKFPIISQEAIKLPDVPSPVAARFEIDWRGTFVAIYAVHLPTPRDALRHHSRGAFLLGVIGLPGTPLGEKRRIYQQFWDGRIAAAELLIQRIKQESLPTIVAGDFNAPQAGYIHGLFEDFLDDSHKEAGSGFGFTFPGVTRNPLSLGGPWMRIDYILYAPTHWTAVAAVAEKERPSQHRALAAVLEFSE